MRDERGREWREERCWVCNGRPLTNPRVSGSQIIVDTCYTCGGSGVLYVRTLTDDDLNELRNEVSG